LIMANEWRQTNRLQINTAALIRLPPFVCLPAAQFGCGDHELYPKAAFSSHNSPKQRRHPSARTAPPPRSVNCDSKRSGPQATR
jgi:hypothetical protein